MAKIAIIATGGKQYVVSTGTVLNVEKMDGEFKPGDKITFGEVLMVDDGEKATIGKPFISGASVTAELIEEGRAKKVTVIRYRQKSRYTKKKGHRQPYAKVRITALP